RMTTLEGTVELNRSSDRHVQARKQVGGNRTAHRCIECLLPEIREETPRVGTWSIRFGTRVKGRARNARPYHRLCCAPLAVRGCWWPEGLTTCIRAGIGRRSL